MAGESQSKHKADAQARAGEVEAKERVSPPVAGRDSIPQVEEDILRPSEVEENGHTRRRDDDKVCRNESGDYLGHAR